MTLAIDTATPGLLAAGATTTFSLSAFSTAQSNDVILLFIANPKIGYVGLPTTVSDTAGLTWTLRGSYTDANGNNSALYYAIAADPLTSDVVKLTYPSNAWVRALVFGVSGADTSAPFDANSSLPAFANNTSGTWQFATVSTTAAATLVVVANHYDSFADSMAAPWTAIGTPAQFNSAWWQAFTSPQTGVVCTDSEPATSVRQIADALVPASSSTNIDVTSGLGALSLASNAATAGVIVGGPVGIGAASITGFAPSLTATVAPVAGKGALTLGPTSNQATQGPIGALPIATLGRLATGSNVTVVVTQNSGTSASANAGAGALVATGGAATSSAGVETAAGAGAATALGEAAVASAGVGIPAGAGTASLGLLTPSASASVGAEIGGGSLTITGETASASVGGSVSAEAGIGALSIAGPGAAASAGVSATAGIAELSLAGLEAIASTGEAALASAGLGALVVAGEVPALVVGTSVVAGAGGAAFTGEQPSVEIGGSVSVGAGLGTIEASGAMAIVRADTAVSAGVGSASLFGYPAIAGSGTSALVQAILGAATLAGNAPSIRTDAATVSGVAHATLVGEPANTAASVSVGVVAGLGSLSGRVGAAGAGAAAITEAAALQVAGKVPGERTDEFPAVGAGLLFATGQQAFAASEVNGHFVTAGLGTLTINGLPWAARATLPPPGRTIAMAPMTRSLAMTPRVRNLAA